jgi:ABC-2 type transport system ATP-binding protein
VVEHRALEGGPGPGERRLRIRLAVPDAQLATKLGAIAGIRVVEAGERDALVAMPGDDTSQAALLAALVAGGLAVAEFAGERENLHDSYLRTVREGGHA